MYSNNCNLFERGYTICLRHYNIDITPIIGTLNLSPQQQYTR